MARHHQSDLIEEASTSVLSPVENGGAGRVKMVARGVLGTPGFGFGDVDGQLGGYRAGGRTYRSV